VLNCKSGQAFASKPFETNVSYYPPKINEISRAARHCGVAVAADAEGRTANFECGSFVSVSMKIGSESGVIEDIRYVTNGCAYLISAAEILAEIMMGRALTELHGMDRNELLATLTREIDAIPSARIHCADTVIDAFHTALADYRIRRIDEFSGEKALICTCFGISDDALADCISQKHLSTVTEVAAICRAGSGCGSCQPLIQEMIDEAIR